MKRTIVVLAVASLAMAAIAHAGGWATVKLSSTPKGVTAGTVWNVRLTVLQHGVTPLAGIRPAVLISKGPVARTFPARPTTTRGVYRARVIFPSAGTWTWQVDDGFSKVHSYFPVRIGPAPAR